MAAVKKDSVKNAKSPHFVLFGTYTFGMLERWPDYYIYPITEADAITAEQAQYITELRLYSGNKSERIFRAKFIGFKTRTELVAHYGYKSRGTGHGKRYLLFRRLGETKGRAIADKLIIRTKDFARRTSKVARQLKKFLESPDRANPLLSKYLPEIIRLFKVFCGTRRGMAHESVYTMTQ